MNAKHIGALVTGGAVMAGAVAPLAALPAGAQAGAATVAQATAPGTVECVSYWPGTTNCITLNELVLLSLLFGVGQPGARPASFTL